MPVLYRKDCKICKHRNHFKSTKCKVCKSPLSHSPGRPTGSTASEGYKVGRKGGRPTGTTVSEGYKTGQSGGRLGKKMYFSFRGDLPSEWDTSSLNVSPALSNKGSLIGSS